MYDSYALLIELPGIMWGIECKSIDQYGSWHEYIRINTKSTRIQNNSKRFVTPIAVANFFRIVSKLACSKFHNDVGEYFRPYQVGFGTSLGWEIAIHATRSSIHSYTKGVENQL